MQGRQSGAVERQLAGRGSRELRKTDLGFLRHGQIYQSDVRGRGRRALRPPSSFIVLMSLRRHIPWLAAPQQSQPPLLPTGAG